MRTVFVRHGESEANIERVFSNRGWKHPLTPRGRQQAAELAASLAGKHFDRILTSPVMRAVQTAEILAEHLGLQVETAEGLREFDVGEFEGRTDPEGWCMHNDVIARWANGESTASMPGGESLPEIVDRLSRLLQALAGSAEKESNYLLVGHGGLYIVALPHVLSGLSTQFCLEHQLRNCDVVAAEGEKVPLRCISWTGIPVASVGRPAGADGNRP